MNDLFALNNRAYRFWLSQAQANADAMTTIALRLPMLASSGISPAGPSREARKMVTEKIEAVMEGSMKGALAAGDLAFRAMTGQLNPTSFASGIVGMAEASHRPVHRRVRANAKRLSAHKG